MSAILPPQLVEPTNTLFIERIKDGAKGVGYSLVVVGAIGAGVFLQITERCNFRQLPNSCGPLPISLPVMIGLPTVAIVAAVKAKHAFEKSWLGRENAAQIHAERERQAKANAQAFLFSFVKTS